MVANVFPFSVARTAFWRNGIANAAISVMIATTINSSTIENPLSPPFFITSNLFLSAYSVTFFGTFFLTSYGILLLGIFRKRKFYQGFAAMSPPVVLIA